MKPVCALALLSLITLWGSASAQTNTAVPPAEAAPAGHPEDQKISTDLKRYLLGDISLSEGAKAITISTEQQVVTLAGTVPTIREKNSILVHARHAGAVEVHDQIVIKQ